MATHSSTLAWKIPWREEPGRLQSIGLQSQTQLNEGGGFSEQIASFANSNSQSQVGGKASQSEGFKAKISGGAQ